VVSASASTLDRRVRRLERILAASGGTRPAESDGAKSAGADLDAVQRLALLAPRLTAWTRELESRAGAAPWDAADLLAARLLLDDLHAAVRSCRGVATAASGRMQELQRAIKSGRKYLARNARVTAPPDASSD
jgi:hypothetical protein